MPRVKKPPIIDPKEEKKLKAKARRISVKEGSAYSVMDGFGMRYITPYALALGASDFIVSLLASLPNLVGSFAQLYTIRLLERMDRKRIAVFAASIQALMWLLVIGIGLLYYTVWFKSVTPALLVVIYTVLIAFGFLIGPAWTSWMKDLVDEKIGTYFGMRNRVCGIVTLVSMIVAGFVLDYFKGWNVFLGFVILFTIAFIARGISMSMFMRKYEPARKPYHEYHTFGYIFQRLHKDLYGRFTIFIALILFATAVASPFFAVYMLADLHFTYAQFMIVSLSSTIGLLLFMPVWGRFADRYGNRKVMIICGFAIPFVPILWLFTPALSGSTLIVYLVCEEIFSGFVWAGFNLASGNYIYETVIRERIPMYTATFNIVTNMGTFIGALLGGILASLQVHWFGFGSLLTLFLISGVLRMLVFLAMIHSVKEVRPVREFGLKEATWKLRHFTFQDFVKILQ